MAGAVSAVPVAVGLVVAGASTMKSGDSIKYNQLEVQECLEANGYVIILIESDKNDKKFFYTLYIFI